MKQHLEVFGVIATAQGGGTAAALGLDLNTLLVVLLPTIATWFGLVGIGVISAKPLKDIGRQLIGTICMGGIVVIVALATIKSMSLGGEAAAVATLVIAASPVLLWQKLTGAAPGLIDGALGTIGLARKGSEKSEPADKPADTP